MNKLIYYCCWSQNFVKSEFLKTASTGSSIAPIKNFPFPLIATDVSSISTASTMTLELPDVPNHEPPDTETKTGEKKKKSRFSMPPFLKKKKKSKDKSNPDLS